MSVLNAVLAFALLVAAFQVEAVPGLHSSELQFNRHGAIISAWVMEAAAANTRTPHLHTRARTHTATYPCTDTHTDSRECRRAPRQSYHGVHHVCQRPTQHRLRCDGPMAALGRLGVDLVEGYPRCSQDFNAIENCWKLLRERLFVTLPKGIEGRDAFIVRLHTAVAWMNRQKQSSLWHYARNQKERCRECLESDPPGGRTSW